LIQELTEFLLRNKDILDEAEAMDRDEKESYDQLRYLFNVRWTRIPSDRSTETFSVNMAQ
jgi:hypothetical protein